MTPGRRPDGRRTAEDDGQVVLLVLGYTVLLLLLVGVLASATAVHLARSRLAGLADAAAVAAADRLDRDRYFDPSTGGARLGGGPLGGVVPLSRSGVRAAASDYLAAAPVPASLGRVTIAEPTGTPDGRTAEVTLTAVVDPPLPGPLLGLLAGGVPMSVTGRARAVDGPG